MKKSKINKGYLLAFAVFFAMVFTSCYEQKEGCLDIRARNFELDIDQACSDCCEFPELKLAVQHKILTENDFYNLNLGDSIYYDDFGHPFRINSIRLYVSGIHFVAADNSETGVTNEVDFSTLDGTPYTLEDNFAILNPADFSTRVLGEMPDEGLFPTLSLRIGLEEPVLSADPQSFPEDHPLSIQEDSMYQDGRYIISKLEIFRDTTAADTIPSTFNIFADDMPANNLVYLNFPGSFFKVLGYDVQLVLRVDYRRWFTGLDIKNDSEAEIINKISQNISQSFSFIELKFE